VTSLPFWVFAATLTTLYSSATLPLHGMMPFRSRIKRNRRLPVASEEGEETETEGEDEEKPDEANDSETDSETDSEEDGEEEKREEL
jgi:hypothetical protein